MNDLENQLRSLKFSQPNAEWRQEILAECHAHNAKATTTSWKDWLWPSPLAWAAMVLIWLGCGVANQIDRPAKAIATSQPPAGEDASLVALRSEQELEALFQFTPPPRHL